MTGPRPNRSARGSTTGRPVMVLLDALGRRGALRLIWELRDDRRLTFRDLLAACDSNPGALNTRLTELRDLRMVDHRPGGYGLTERGRQLSAIVGELNQRAEAWASLDEEADRPRSG